MRSAVLDSGHSARSGGIERVQYSSEPVVVDAPGIESGIAASVSGLVVDSTIILERRSERSLDAVAAM
jgi:hypothetical protein